jgi:hypothetical protein
MSHCSLRSWLRVQHQRDLAAEPSRHHDMGLRRRFEPALPVLISGRSMANSEVARPKRFELLTPSAIRAVTSRSSR